jgi:hypothetical protein
VCYNFDLHSGCHQLKICSAGTLKIMFTACYGLYEYTVLILDLNHTPTHVMYLMNKVCMRFLDKLWYSSATYWPSPRTLKNKLNTQGLNIREHKLHAKRCK